MKFSETIAASCRYGEIAEAIWSDWDVIWEDSEADYQGHASFLANKGRKWVFYEWWYGSCSGCDGWEAANASDDDITKEMKSTAMTFNSKKELMGWLNMLEGRAPLSNYSMEEGGGLAAGIDILGGGMLDRVNAIRAHFKMEPYKPKA